MSSSIQGIIDQGPLPRPKQELWQGINPYQQQWIIDAHGPSVMENLMGLESTEQRKQEVLRLDEAKYRQSKSTNGASSTETLNLLYSVASRQAEFGHLDEAEKTFSDLTTIYSDTPDGKRKGLHVSYGLAHLRAQQGRYKESEQMYREALPILAQPPLGTDSMQYLGAWRSIIEAVANQPERWEEANELLKTGYELVAKMKGGRFEKFEEEEREAMDEVRESVLKLRPKSVQKSSGAVKL